MNEATARAALVREANLVEESLILSFTGYTLALRSNSVELLDTLANYFGPLAAKGSAADLAPELTQCTLIAIDGDEVPIDVPFVDWQREPGKSGRKDSVYDLDNVRLLRKVRTGVTFLQSSTDPVAVGPLLKYESQLVNFVITQYMGHLQREGWLIGHASALGNRSAAIAIAGLSGGGKSTLMLRLLEREKPQFISNDRIFLRHSADKLQVRGVPKLPRVNPGTLLNNPRLRPLLPTDRQQILEAMPAGELWDLEEKYDVPVGDLYGPGKLLFEDATLQALIVLNWSRASNIDTRLRWATAHDEPALMDAIMKSPGPFYQYADGRFLSNGAQPSRAPYLDLFSTQKLAVLEGRIDFLRAAELVENAGLL